MITQWFCAKHPQTMLIRRAYRDIDLSHRAAQLIGIDGVGPVTLQVLGR